MVPRRGLNEWDINKLKRQVEQHIECSAFPNPWQVKSGILEDSKEKSSLFSNFYVFFLYIVIFIQYIVLGKEQDIKETYSNVSMLTNKLLIYHRTHSLLFLRFIHAFSYTLPDNSMRNESRLWALKRWFTWSHRVVVILPACHAGDTSSILVGTAR